MVDLLDQIRAEIAADDEVLKEARKRRNLTAEAAMGIPGALRRFSSGSVAHGTVNRPVKDADGGVVLDRRTYPVLGPDGEDVSPEEVVASLCNLVGPKVRTHYPEARAMTSKRGLRVFFGAPIDDQDPTVDLIVTLTRKDEPGLWIPNLERGTWDASDPEKHTELFTSGTRSVTTLRARVVRLAKAWNKQWNEPGLSSFNLEALAWEYVRESAPLDEALTGFFGYAHAAIREGNTQDPAGVSDPIRLLSEQSIVVRRLKGAADHLERALNAANDEDVVQEALATVFRDFVDAPRGSKAGFAAALRLGTVSATSGGLALGAVRPLKATRAFGDLDAK